MHPWKDKIKTALFWDIAPRWMEKLTVGSEKNNSSLVRTIPLMVEVVSFPETSAPWWWRKYSSPKRQPGLSDYTVVHIRRQPPSLSSRLEAQILQNIIRRFRNPRQCQMVTHPEQLGTQWRRADSMATWPQEHNLSYEWCSLHPEQRVASSVEARDASLCAPLARHRGCIADCKTDRTHVV
jgi:hypothetical protein